MPNWCINHVVITGDKDNLDYLEKTEFIFQKFIPCPKALLDTTDSSANEEQMKDNEKRYGYRSWYNWKSDKWGTKWDRGNYEANRINDRTLQLEFNTAWGMPLPIFEYVSKRYDVRIEVDYDIELGNGAGNVVFQKGKIVNAEKHEQENWLGI